MLLAACSSGGGHTALGQDACRSRLQALEAKADAARAEARPAMEAYRNNPTSFEAKTAVELALQRSAKVSAETAREAEALRLGPCKGRL